MPEQLPEKLINEHPEVDLGDLKLYAIIRGDAPAKPTWRNQYRFQQAPRPSNAAVCKVLWRGYMGQFRLLADGRLRLEGFDYPFAPLQPADPADEYLTGDFWLLMKVRFFGECTYIPFTDGRIVTDPTRWVRAACDVEDKRPVPVSGVRRRRTPLV